MYEATHLRQYCFVFPLLIFKCFQNLFVSWHYLTQLIYLKLACSISEGELLFVLILVLYVLFK